MIIQSVWQLEFGFFGEKAVVVEPSEGTLTSDAGLLPIRQFDEQIGLTAQVAAALDDPRDPGSVDHTFLEMVRMRVYGILADYPDQNDHDVLRGDPVFKLLAGRSPEGDDLASQPTLSRFENMISVRDLLRLEELQVRQFVDALWQRPAQLILDIDVFDDPTHGDQQLTFWHDFYGQYQYLVRTITCANNDLVAMACLLHGTAHPALGADDDLRRVVRAVRERFPDVQILLRADSGFGVPTMYDVCEELGIDYEIGVRMNKRLQKQSQTLLEEVQRRYTETHQPQRDAMVFPYQAGSWSHPRWCILKAETTGEGSNRRAVLTNRPGAVQYPLAAYEEYADRGESENRNKELKCGLRADRLSDHRYLANLFRVNLHVAAHNLLVRLRPIVADPPPEDPQAELPREALPQPERRRWFNRRRGRDPLGEGHPCTWRTHLIKVAAQVVVRARRVIVRLASNWPYLDYYQRVSRVVLALSAPARLEPG
jgi:hypothetical protein